MSCSANCYETRMRDPRTGEMMRVATCNGGKYAPGPPHPPCGGCEGERERIMREARNLKDGEELHVHRNPDGTETRRIERKQTLTGDAELDRIEERARERLRAAGWNC